MNTKMIEACYEISINRHHAGFGMYELGEHNHSPEFAYRELSDLEQEMIEGAQGILLPLDEALQDADFIAAGVEDVRGKIYGGDPYKIYSILLDGAVLYTGVEIAEVGATHWGK